MPVTPQVQPLDIPIGVPRSPAGEAWKALGGAFGDLGQIAGEIQKRQDSTWAVQAKANFLNGLPIAQDQLAQAEPDPMKRLIPYQEMLQNQIQDIVKTAPSRAAAAFAQNHLTDLATSHFIDYRGEQVKQAHDQQVASLVQDRQMYADLIATSTDPALQNDLYKTYEGKSLGDTIGAHPAQSQVEHLKGMGDFHERIAASYINNGDLSSYEKYTETPQFKALSSDTQYRLDTRANAQFNRVERDAERINKSMDNAWVDKNLDSILKNGNAASTVRDFITENRKWLTNGDIIYMNKRIPELLGLGAKEDSDAMFGVMKDYEDNRLKLEGLTTPGLAASTLKTIDSAGLDNKATDTAKRRVMQDLERANMFRQSQTGFAQSQTRFTEEQARKSATNVIVGAFDPSAMSAEDRKAYDQLIMRSHLTGNSIANDKNAMINSTVEEAIRTGIDPATVARRKIQEYKTNVMPKPKPTLTPAEKQLFDTLKTLRNQ